MSDTLRRVDGDALSRAVFAAGRRLGRSDAFLARELADAALHFLATAEGDDPDEVLQRVVRELGHPDLALALQSAGTEGRPAPIAADELPATALERVHRAAALAFRELARRDVYSPDLVAAADAGLITFFDADSPTELAGGVIAVGDPSAAFETILAARERYGQFVVFDGPEYSLSNGRSAAVWARWLRAGLLATGLRAIVNLNCPNRNSDELPLFPNEPDDRDARLDDLRQTLIAHLLWEGASSVRIDWHMTERDFRADGRIRLLRLCRRALAGNPIAFVFDRGVRVPLAEGIDRVFPELLCAIGVNLPRLAAHLGEHGEGILKRMVTLGRLATAAGRARRAYLRRQGRPELTEGFRLERARIAVVPIGLGSFAGYTTDDSGIELAQSALRALRLGLDETGCLDSPPGWIHDPAAGVTCWGVGNPRQQVLRSALLHAEIEAGTAVIELPPTERPAEELAHLLWVGSRTPGLVRVRIRRSRAVQPSLGPDW
ncbi:MAG: hypothetical protein U0746_13760 [Gemmataceae bacterium]